jgi:hypothetical protein
MQHVFGTDNIHNKQLHCRAAQSLQESPLTARVKLPFGNVGGPRGGNVLAVVALCKRQPCLSRLGPKSSSELLICAPYRRKIIVAVSARVPSCASSISGSSHGVVEGPIHCHAGAEVGDSSSRCAQQQHWCVPALNIDGGFCAGSTSVSRQQPARELGKQAGSMPRSRFA